MRKLPTREPRVLRAENPERTPQKVSPEREKEHPVNRLRLSCEGKLGQFEGKCRQKFCIGQAKGN